MAGTVPVLSIVFMGMALVISTMLPIGLCVYFRRAKKADLSPFFIGCAVMILFAFVLESLAHRFILNSKVGAIIIGNTLLYGLYGGAMAGLFEETGRFIAFKTILRKKQNNKFQSKKKYLTINFKHHHYEHSYPTSITSR